MQKASPKFGKFRERKKNQRIAESPAVAPESVVGRVNLV